MIIGPYEDLAMPYHRRLRFAWFVAGLLPVAAACNALTGADDLRIEGEDGTDGGGASVSQGPSSGAGLAGPGSSGTGMQGPPLVGAAGVTLREIVMYQGVSRPVMTAGAPATSDIPIVQGRDALFRLFYDTDGSFAGGLVTARFHVDGHPESPVEVVQPITGSSSEDNISSTINLEVPGSMLSPGMTYRVEILQEESVSPVDNPAAKYPAEGSTPLSVGASPAVLHVELIPIQYAADGSNRLPDTSEGQLTAYRELFYGIYPLSNVDITVHAPVNWPSTISPNGAGWTNLLDSLANFRAQENTPDNVYWYGIFMPTSSVGTFCGGGCVAGLGFVTSPSDTFGRVAIGLGYPGSIATETAVHEVGHNHGRNHAPCGGAQGVDGGFPYSGGSIGVWGYNIVTKQLFSPNQTADLMGYCTPLWVSDYTFKAFFSRVQIADGASMIFPPEMMDLTWERVRIDGQGNATFLDPIQLHKPPMNEPTQVELETETGHVTVTGQFYKYDHLDGGLLLWPQPESAITGATIHLGAKLIHATK
jgi:hypothetical protein